MTDAHRTGHHPIDVELQIDQVTIADPAEATATVRCLRGPVRYGARFDQIRDSVEVIDLELTRIHVYGRSVEELAPPHSALVTLRGTGAQLLTAGTSAAGWQVLQGTNPPTP
ncbi:hypothetical protein ACFVFS_34610 [Kitasatospora sp. NPDC057692]|uniref:hypothetical protein n=1 Tax=Kitasatospora sp. NPDC057692 TaxID=3346215 RepID=UPI003684727F